MQSFLSAEPPSAEQIEEALIDFGFFHSLAEVTLMFSEYTNNKLLGYAGGVLDQPEEYWRDMTMMKWLDLWVRHVAPMPRMEQVSVFETLRNEGRLSGNWLGGRDGG